MPPSHELLTDDYVAELLTKEAKDCSLKYSALGLDAFKSDKRPANQPKPNTRFLNTIIRDTNSHNRALLAKENAEAQARLRHLEEADRQKRDDEERRQRRSNPGARDTRKRMLGDIAAILGGGPSKRRRPDEGDRNSARTTSDSRGKHHARDDSGRKDESREGDVKPKSRNRPRSRSRSRSRRRSQSRSRSRSRSRGTRDDQRSDSRDGHRNRHSHRRSERHRDHRSRSPEDSGDRHRRRRERLPRERDRERDQDRRHRHLSGKETREPAPSTNKDDDSDSDPLDDIIGPAPPSKSAVRRRGRGHIAAMSGIDSRFASDYDPTIDVAPESDGEAGDDWDNAVEVFRDRQKWKQQGAERLRSVGFSEAQVRKWEKGDQKDESDVQWNKAGGMREWDRGKVVDADGDISPDLEFGRLKGT
ncbi:hypothetical protein F5X97DRAFT_272768 [Nemania serpens]|nr:hypothetical protein F5X97DRAFT_272768 [Nemania serpens]